MAVFLPEELVVITPRRLPVKFRPVYYSAEARSDIRISEDFEGYLILQSEDSKQKTLAWISEASKLQSDNQDHTELLTEYIQLRRDDASAKTAELAKILDVFDRFKSDLLSDGADSSRYANIEELNFMVRSTQAPVEDLAIERSRAVHEQRMADSQTNRLKVDRVTDDARRELESWKTPITAYPGQTYGG